MRQLLRNAVVSKKTTLGMVVAAIAISWPQLEGVVGLQEPMLNQDGTPVLDESGRLVYEDAEIQPWMLIAAMALMYAGAQSRDGDVPSERHNEGASQ